MSSNNAGGGVAVERLQLEVRKRETRSSKLDVPIVQVPAYMLLPTSLTAPLSAYQLTT